jgi:chromate reductase
MRVVGICGSLQSSSSNLTLLRRAGELIDEMSSGTVAFELFDGVRDLPLFDPDIERDGPAPSSVRAWRGTLAGADALLIASPEYGHSLPGALKNAIDWVIGSGELEGKVVGVTAAVVHEARGRRGLDALLGTLAAVSARVVGGRGIVVGEGFDDQLRELVRGIFEAAAPA